jgi:hypothetical protein
LSFCLSFFFLSFFLQDRPTIKIPTEKGTDTNAFLRDKFGVTTDQLEAAFKKMKQKPVFYFDFKRNATAEEVTSAIAWVGWKKEAEVGMGGKADPSIYRSICLSLSSFCLFRPATLSPARRWSFA